MPDDQKRIDHILTKQVFGMATGELTWLLARRSVYCTKKANGKFSVASPGTFTTAHGNILYPRKRHTWNKQGRCIYCGANKENYDRDESREAYAYPFIHRADPTKEFDMKFDVIVGNPPYQMSDGGFGRSASPIYNRFVQQAKNLEPRYLTMVIPSRWFGGGKGVSDFREEMLGDDRIRILVDYEDANEVFPGVDMAGGVCYFLWDRDNSGLCDFSSIQGKNTSTSVRKLNEFDTFIRHPEAESIVRKVMDIDEPRMSNQVSSSKPFGLRTFVRPKDYGDLILRWQKGEGPYPREEITTGTEMIDRWKVITSYVGHDHAGNPGKDGKRRVISKTDVIPPGTICNETYLVIGHYGSEIEARNLIKYMKTKFFRFLVSQFMYSHHITRSAYAFVPVLDMSETWTDTKLSARYKLSAEEVAFVESKIREWC